METIQSSGGRDEHLGSHERVLARRSLDLSSLLDDIPEERPLSGTSSSEEKEITRLLDSGIGEWDSECSRKTSFSSQGRLSPDFAMDKTPISKDHRESVSNRSDIQNNIAAGRDHSAKRRRSGIEMVNNKVPVLATGNNPDIDVKPIVRTSLPRIPKSSRASGIWTRKVSAAGVACLRMADEMVEVMRNGGIVMVPRKISDHIPVIPIHSVDRFVVTETNENLGLDDEEMQIYKTPKSDIYELHRHRWEFFGKMDFRKMMILALDGDAWMSAHQKYELMKSLLSEKEQRKMEKMLAKGYSHEEVVNIMMEEASKKSGNTGLAKKLQKLLLADDLDEDALLEEMGKELGDESKKKMEELLSQGHSIKDVMKKMMEEGRSQNEETRDTAETMAHLMKSKKKHIKTNMKEIESMLDERLDTASRDKMKEMLAAGVPMKEVLEHFVKQAHPEENLTPLEKKMRAMTEGQELSQYKMFELLKEQMDAESGKKMDEMVKSGCTLEEVMEHFMKKGKTKEQAQNEKSEELRQKMEGSQNMTPDEIIDMLRSELGAEDKAQLEKMLKRGCPLTEITEHFLNRGMDADSEEKSEFQLKMEGMLDDKNLNEDEILALMRSQMDDGMKAEIKAMLDKGYSKQDVINHLLKNVKTVEEKEKDSSKKLMSLFDDQEMSEEEKISLLKKQLNDEDQAQMGKMLESGCSIEEIIGHFMNRVKSPTKEKSCFAQHIESLISGKDLTADEILSIVREHLDDESKQKMEEMLKMGYTDEDIVNHFLRTAKTKEEQLQETANKIKALMTNDDMSDENKLEILRNQLSEKDLQQMEDMLKKGGSLEDVMQQILKSKSLDNLTETELSRIINSAIAKNKNLSQSDILDLIREQIDPKAKAELEMMLSKGFSEQEVIDHFLACGKTVHEQQTETSEQIKAKLGNGNMSPEDSIEVMRTILNDTDRVQMDFMLQQGCSMEEVIEHFTNRGIDSTDPSQKPTDFAIKIKKLSDGKGLTVDQMLTLMENEIGDEGKAKMEDMLKKGYSKQDIVDHFMRKGKTQVEENKDTSRKLSELINIEKMSDEEIESILKEQLSPKDRKLMEQMLKEGKSFKSITKHFIERIDILPAETALAVRIKKLSGNRKLSVEEIVTLLKNQLGEEGKKEMENMLSRGISMEDIISHFMEHGRTEEEEHKDIGVKLKSRVDKKMSDNDIKDILLSELSTTDKKAMEDMLEKGSSIKDILQYFVERGDNVSSDLTLAERMKKMSAGKNLSDEEKHSFLQDQLGDESRKTMEKMLASGMSMENVINHLIEHGKTKDEEESEKTSALEVRIKKLSGGRKLSNEDMITLIQDQLGEESKNAMEKMISMGVSLEKVISHFLKHGKTLEEEQNEIGKKLKSMITETMSDGEIKSLLNSNLSENDKELMEKMIQEGKSMKDIAQHFVERSHSEPKESALSERIKKISGGRKLSNEEMVSLLQDQLGDYGKSEMQKMLARGVSIEDVISHFMEHGKTKEEEQRDIGEKLKSINTEVMTQEEKTKILQESLSLTDNEEMNEMLQKGFSVDDILNHFKNRGNETELAMRVKKLSGNRKLSNEEIMTLIRDQLSEESKMQIDDMLKTGISMEDVINHFMANGKTIEQEQREVGENLRKLSGQRNLSSEELVALMDSNLGMSDKAQMQQMLKNGCSVEEVFDLFVNRRTTPDIPQTELAKRVKKYSKGKLLAKQEILRLIKFQLSEEGKVKMEKMLQQGYKVEDVVEHFLSKGKTYDEEYREVGEKLSSLLDVKSMSESKIMEIMNSVLGSFDKTQVEEMIRRGCQTPDIVDLFLNRGKGLSKKTEFSTRMERLLEGKCLSSQDVLEMMKENLDDETIESIEILLHKGYTVQDVIEHLWKNGKTPEQKQKEIAEKMLTLLDGDISEDQVLQMMRKQLGSAGCKELEDMLSKGCSLTEILDVFLMKPSELEAKEEDTEFAKKIKLLMGDKTLNAEEMLELIKNELDSNSRLQLEEMLKAGCTMDEVIHHFMTREKNKKGQRRNLFGRKIYELTKGKKLTKKELLCLMKNYLDEDSLSKMEDMIKKGYPTEDIIDYFLKNGKTPHQALREKSQQKEKAKKEAAKRIHKMVEGNSLSNEEILAILKLQMCEDDKQQLEIMMNKGCTTKEIIEHFMNRDVSDDETEKTSFEKKMEELMEGKDLSNEEILDLMKHELDDESLDHMMDMLSKGYTKEDVIKYFMKHGDEGNEFVQEMKKLNESTKDMSKEEILDIMKSKLGVMSQKKMEDMMREGYSADEIIKHLMTHGQTQEQETKLFTRRMSILIEGDKAMSDKEKVDKLKEHLGKEAKFMVEELMKNGFSYTDIIALFLKHGNDVNSLVGDSFFIREIIFPDEPKDAEMHKNRDVFSVIDWDDIKSRISYMSPSGKTHIFGLFFEMVLEVIAGKDLTHREILDLMRSRMGGGYAKEFDDLRKKGFSLQQVVNYFLKRDEETIAESRLVAKLKAEARVDSRVYLKREYSKEKWGVSLTYTYSKDHGLHLILDEVIKDGPAWESGVRAGDVIVTINDWLIVLMDRPQVAAHLFQAGANIVKLGIQKTRGDSPDRYLGVY